MAGSRQLYRLEFIDRYIYEFFGINNYI
jgi:hypothetical protein